MKPTVEDFYNVIDSFAPFKTAMDFDNCGILVGKPTLAVNGALLCLDVTQEVIDEAVEKGANLIITHHPVIFSPLKNLSYDSLPYRLAAEGISVISAHTNLDIAKGGVNDCLAAVLGLTNIRPLEGLSGLNSELSLGRMGELETDMNGLAFGAFVAKALATRHVNVTTQDEKISTVALCGGSGGDLIATAQSKGADALVVGECKYSRRLEAAQIGITLIEAGHYHTEAVVLKPLADILKANISGVTIEVAKACADPAVFV